ncbi:MAG: hypothetical protein H6740_02970 [Alphaproteobacteria bacterium]|nr:hypothetical protein [Alphaproteobacteria bacterium]
MLSQSINEAVAAFKKHPGPWVVLTLLVAIVGSFIPYLGALLLLPNVLREAKACLSEDRAPDLGQLFDLSHAGTDIVAMLLYVVAQTLGILLCCVGWPFAWIGFWYAAELSADDRVSGVDALRASWAYVSQKPGETIAMALLCLVGNSVAGGVGFGLGLLLSGPITFLTWAAYWRLVRADVYAAAEQAGIAVKPAGLLEGP